MEERIDGLTQRSLRLWPGVVIVALQWLTRFLVPVVAPDFAGFAMLAGPLGLLAQAVDGVRRGHSAAELEPALGVRCSLRVEQPVAEPNSLIRERSALLAE